MKIDPALEKARGIIVEYLAGRRDLEETLSSLHRIYCSDEINIVISACGEEFRKKNADAFQVLIKQLEK